MFKEIIVKTILISATAWVWTFSILVSFNPPDFNAQAEIIAPQEIEGIKVVDYGIIPYYWEKKLIKEAAREVADSREYKLNVFDCTDFSKKLVKELKKEKIKSQCSAGYYLKETDYLAHTWVSVFIDYLRIEVEATGGYIIPKKVFEREIKTSIEI